VTVSLLFAGASGAATAPLSCKATGDKLETRLPVGPFDKRIGQTLCFDFTGDATKDIVFSGWVYASNGAHYWAAFRGLGGDSWKLVIFKRDCCRVRRANRMRISRVGATIVVTQPIYRTRDLPCCPSGGTRTGRWRWTGAKLKLVGTTDKPR
jgi:hypothetical protein